MHSLRQPKSSNFRITSKYDSITQCDFAEPLSPIEHTSSNDDNEYTFDSALGSTLYRDNQEVTEWIPTEAALWELENK